MEGTTDAEEPSSSAASAMPESEIAKDEMGRGDGAGRQLEKPRVVRIKRKREQAPIETLCKPHCSSFKSSFSWFVYKVSVPW